MNGVGALSNGGRAPTKILASELTGMAHEAAGSIVRQIESLFEGGSVTGLTDRQLLERFTARRDAAGEAAFAALVTRHGPMVLHVCRQLLGDRHHAEDAFQAVFLVLARKARSIRDPNRLGAWLYGVAIRTARKAKVRLARRRRHEEGDAMSGPGPGATTLAEPTAPPADEPVLAREQAEALHDEIERLPQSFRLPVVLCYFEGLTLDEAARRLRWPAGTVGSRLARARDKLRRGLTRRGIVLPAAAMAAVLNPKSASARVSSLLCDTTTKAAIRFAAGQAAGEAASALAREVLRSMLLHKLRITVLALLALTAVATGAGLLTHSLAMMKDEPKRSPIGQQQATPAAKPEVASQRPAPGRMFVTGRVLDPQGKPVPNAAVMIYARRKLFERPIGFESHGPCGHQRNPLRWIGPIPDRRAANLVVKARPSRHHRPRIRLRNRLGRSRPGRRAAHRRRRAPTGTGDPGPPARCPGPARPGRQGLDWVCRSAPVMERQTGRISCRIRRRTCPPGLSRQPPTLTAASPCAAWVENCWSHSPSMTRRFASHFTFVETGGAVFDSRLGIRNTRGQARRRLGSEETDDRVATGPDHHRARNVC